MLLNVLLNKKIKMKKNSLQLWLLGHYHCPPVWMLQLLQSLYSLSCVPSTRESAESERMKLAHQAQQMSVELEQVREQLAMKNKDNLKVRQNLPLNRIATGMCSCPLSWLHRNFYVESLVLFTCVIVGNTSHVLLRIISCNMTCAPECLLCLAAERWYLSMLINISCRKADNDHFLFMVYLTAGSDLSVFWYVVFSCRKVNAVPCWCCV